MMKISWSTVKISRSYIEKQNFVFFMYHIYFHHLPSSNLITLSSIHSPSSFICIICFLLLWSLNPPHWGSEPDALTTTPCHQFKQVAFEVLLLYWRTTEYFNIYHWSSLWFLQSFLPVFLKYLLYNKYIHDQ